MTIATAINETTITCVIDDKIYAVQRDNPAAKMILKALSEEAPKDKIIALFDQLTAVKTYMGDGVEIVGNSIKINGEEVHGVIVNRILKFMRSNLPYKPLIKFLERIQNNPSKRSVDELYAFLEHKNLPITPEGKFLAYKAIRYDWTDKYTGKFSNTIGSVLQMPRNKVDDDANRGCSYGFHCGALDYVKWYGSVESGDDRCVIVEVDPADVVSVPHDHNYSKVRTSKYKVIAEYKGPLPDTLSTNDEDNELEEYDEDDVIVFEDVELKGFGDEAYDDSDEESLDEDNNLEFRSEEPSEEDEIEYRQKLAETVDAEEKRSKHNHKCNEEYRQGFKDAMAIFLKNNK